MAATRSLRTLPLAEDLLALLAVARSGALTTAAHELGIDPSTASRRVARLEKRVGQRLFTRVAGSWRLTAAGAQLRACAEDVHRSLVEATLAVGDRSAGPLRGKVRLLTPEGFGTFLAPRALAATTRAHPELEIEVCTFTGKLPLAARSYDIAVSLERPRIRGLHAQPLCTYDLGLFATAEYLHRHPPIGAPADLQGHAFVYYLDSTWTFPSLRVLPDLVPDASARYQANSVSAQAQLVLAGHGIGLLPRYLTEFHPGLVAVLPELVSIAQQYWIGTPSEVHRAPHVQRVARDLLAACPA